MQGKAVAPVHLRAEVVDDLLLPACRQPCGHIAVLLVEVVVRVALRADAEPQGGVCRLHGAVHFRHQRGNVLPPPRGKVGCAACRKLHRVHGGIGGGVKVIVKVDAVHRVVLQKLCHPLHHIVCGGRHGGVQVQPLPGGAQPVRVGVCQIILCQIRRHRRRGAQTVGVDPRLHPDAPAVRLGQKDIQRVKAGVFALHPGAQMAPREQTAAVQRIPEGAHLRQHGVQSQPGAIVQQLRCPGAEGVLGGEIQQRPVQIAHPHRPPLSGGQGGVGCRGRILPGGSSVVCIAFLPQVPPRRSTGGNARPGQKGSAAKAAFCLGFRRPAALGHRVSSCVL